MSIPGSTNAPLSTAAVFADNVQDLLGTGTLQVHPTGIIVVNSIDDAVNSSPSLTTLRDAINKANADEGEDLIVFDRSLFSTAQTITLNSGELDITHNLDIIAPRDTLTGGDLVTVSGNNASRVFGVKAGATVSIDGLIVADGSVTAEDGGGINNSGTLTLDSSIVLNNSTEAFTPPSTNTATSGGGIYNDGKLTVINSTISGNSAAPYGGGISSFTNLTVINSTISGNSAVDTDGILDFSNGTFTIGTLNNSGGGGIYINDGGNSTILNTTISGNSASQGGGIFDTYFGTITLLFSTITQNIAAVDGGGVYQNKSYFISGVHNNVVRGSNNVRNTIIASNLLNKNGVNSDVSATFSSNGYNLIGDGTGSTGFGATGDLVGTTDNPIDPLLAPLAFNGGSTQTVALLPGSPAIGAADPTILDTDPITDQRGLPRRAADSSADIGAYELS